MREHGLERRRAVAREREQQRGLKPAAMLVAAFEIHVGLPGAVAEFGVLECWSESSSGRRISTAREDEPESIHTSSVSLDLATASAPFQSFGFTSDQSSAADFSNQTFEPCFLDQVGGVADDLRVEDRLRPCAS